MNILSRLGSIPLWHFVWLSVVFSEILTAGMEFALKGRVTPDYMVTGAVVSLVVSGVVIYLISRTRKSERALAEALSEAESERDMARKYLDVAGVMFIIVGADETVRLINRRGLDILGLSEAGIIGKNWFDNFIPEAQRQETRKVFSALMAGGMEMAEYHENPVLAADGSERLIAWHNTLLTDNAGSITGTLSSGEDITERRRMERKLEEASTTDDLTGLYNRRGFFNYAEQQFHIAKRNGKRISLYFLDLDGLKAINDRFGHKEGDNALVETSNILRNIFRKSDVIARIGGDEFSVLTTCTHIDSPDVMDARLKKALDAFNESRRYPFHLSLSAGFVEHDPETPVEMDTLLDMADRMMFERKRKNR